MKIYSISNSLDLVGAGVKWSETTKPRKPMKNTTRWYVSDVDNMRLGPVPESARAQIDNHWALSLAKNSDLPNTFGTIAPNHFTGAPFARKKVCDVFETYAEGDIEIIPINKFWSIYDNAEVAEQYYVANFFGAADVINSEKTDLIPIQDAPHGITGLVSSQKASNTFVHPAHFMHRHILRDTTTSNWYCDDIFRQAIEDVAPNTYQFDAVSNS